MEDHQQPQQSQQSANAYSQYLKEYAPGYAKYADMGGASRGNSGSQKAGETGASAGTDLLAESDRSASSANDCD